MKSILLLCIAFALSFIHVQGLSCKDYLNGKKEPAIEIRIPKVVTALSATYSEVQKDISRSLFTEI